MHGARGVLQSVLKAYPDANIGVHVVWEPMLGSDNEDAARDISRMFDDPRVRQYWDPNRRSGIAYAKHVFPTYLKDMRAAIDAGLPPDHFLRKMKRDWKDVQPEQAPLWDIALTYDPGARWQEKPPRPVGMVKQIAFYGPQEGGSSGLFFTDFEQAPFDADWAVELAKAMKTLTGKKPTPSRARTAAPAKETAEPANSAPPVSLAESLEPLRKHFNDHKDKHRFVALLSPT